jgi:uncharacterized protein YebE (UPF0316 family)
MEYLLLFALTIIQNASFTLVSRARNSANIWYNGGASVFSNGIWLLVISKVVTNLDSVGMMVTYVTGATIGSVLMQWFAMSYLEQKRK